MHTVSVIALRSTVDGSTKLPRGDAKRQTDKFKPIRNLSAWKLSLDGRVAMLTLESRKRRIALAMSEAQIVWTSGWISKSTTRCNDCAFETIRDGRGVIVSVREGGVFARRE